MSEREESATVQLKVRVKERMRAALEEAARQNDWTLNREISQRLDQSLDFEERLGGATLLSFFQASALAIKVVEGRTGKRWNEDTATWHAAKAMLEQQWRNWRPTPPNAPAITAALAHQRKLAAAVVEAMDAYRDKYPAQPMGALAELNVFLPIGQRLRLPAEALPHEDQEQMTAEWVGITTLSAELKKADAAVDEAFREYDAAMDAGTQLARDLVAEIDAVQRRDEGKLFYRKLGIADGA
jgi:hypothetical protein